MDALKEQKNMSYWKERKGKPWKALLFLLQGLFPSEFLSLKFLWLLYKDIFEMLVSIKMPPNSPRECKMSWPQARLL